VLPAPAAGSAASSSLFVESLWSAATDSSDTRSLGSDSGRPGEHRPDVLLFLMPSAGYTRLEPLLTREALASLFSASPLLFTQPERAAAHLETLRRLARQCCSYRLYLSLGPRRRPQTLSTLLPAIARSHQGIGAQP
jgi:hypothetical protein